MNKTIAFFIATQFIIVQIFAQKLPSIQLDRPDQTECPYITPKKYIQLETGFNIENVNSNFKSYVYPTALWKYGLTDKFEFRLITELVTEKFLGSKTTGLIPITVGFKTKICEEKGLLPKTSVIGHLTTATLGSKKFNTKYIAPSFRFLMQHTINEKVVLAYNLGAEWDGDTKDHSYLYTLTTGITLTEKLGCYFELFGFLPQSNKANHSFDGGITYLVNNDFILDLSSGIGLTNTAPKNYVSLGISYRFKVIK